MGLTPEFRGPGGRASELRSTWLEIDLRALATNYRQLLDRVSPRRVWCVVKADAYGHGAIEVSRELDALGADSFAVATVDEALELRRAGISGRILVMAGIEPMEAPVGAAAQAVVDHGLEVAVWRAETARRLGTAAAESGGEPVRLHLKVDTGMGRLGVTMGETPDAAIRLAAEIADADGALLEGVFSNLAAADDPNDDPGRSHTAAQVDRFNRLCGELSHRDLLPPERHLSNSAAISHHPASWEPAWCTGVRPGLSLFGFPSCEGDATHPLEPVMSWHSVVAAVRSLPAGWPLGYGARRRTGTDCEIAVVPVGYHDGFPRSLSDCGDVLVGGRRAKVVGTISMDLTLVDITGIPRVSAGDPVVLLGRGAEAGEDSIDAQEMARHAGTIAHEILCRVGPRVPRRYLDASR